jgi:hypothetical protein
VEGPLERGEDTEECSNLVVQYLQSKLEVIQSLSKLEAQTVENGEAILQLQILDGV